MVPFSTSASVRKQYVREKFDSLYAPGSCKTVVSTQDADPVSHCSICFAAGMGTRWRRQPRT